MLYSETSYFTSVFNCFKVSSTDILRVGARIFAASSGFAAAQAAASL